jgi:hypothetical protein
MNPDASAIHVLLLAFLGFAFGRNFERLTADWRDYVCLTYGVINLLDVPTWVLALSVAAVFAAVASTLYDYIRARGAAG